MAGAAIVTSSSTGHGGFPPTVALVGNPKFLVFGKPINCTGDSWAPHSAPNTPPHAGTSIGSSKFLVFGKPAAMIGDSLTCGDTIATGEPKFNIS
ncbi:PAAR domain-containing protein [Aliivibrio salmonicida]|uniref:PAAR domain-containing protein n=1 Tax=Aliivibrio salmonicida TaxID=40269 RepID=UPI003D0CA1C6